ncbi:MAG: lipoprotein signal peptidase [uncultured bacterium]|nr:MAG: lipoprotein signal peptidase [uncultured bacterium]
MKKRIGMIFGYGVVSLAVIAFDRISKWYAIHTWQLPQQINQFLSFELMYNRGISWGLFHSASNCLFTTVSFIIAAVTIAVAVLAIQKFKTGEWIGGEVLVVAGSISNIIDRVMFGGVVDFIHLSYGHWSWPLFNVADMVIVAGVALMVWEQYRS